MKFLGEERVGEARKNRFGSVMTVIKYKSYRDVFVRFDNGVTVHTDWSCFLAGKVKNPYDRSILGIGYIGQGKYKTKSNDKPTRQYQTWYDMLKRVYDEKYHERFPTYKRCSVADEWHNFQTFAKWYDQNYYQIDGERMHLDKDILVKGNQIYSPETCVFVPIRINQIFLKSNAIRGETPIGVAFCKRTKMYTAKCSNGKGGGVNLGYSNTKEESFQVYKIFKEKLIKQVAQADKNKIPKKLFDALMRYEVEIDD